MGVDERVEVVVQEPLQLPGRLLRVQAVLLRGIVDAVLVSEDGVPGDEGSLLLEEVAAVPLGVARHVDHLDPPAEG